MKKIILISITACLIASLGGCGGPVMRIKHEIEPIYVTVDVNIKVQKELENFFDFEDDIMNSNEKEAGDETNQ